jgi:D-alanyl-lipoteichoic acid acyltransferase DltB (MBOAT superfamily)
LRSIKIINRNYKILLASQLKKQDLRDCAWVQEIDKMVFASGIFLFIFLPVTLIGTAILKNKPVMWRNVFLLLMSMFFYMNSGVKELGLMLLSVLMNYFFARMIACFADRAGLKKTFLIVAVCYNVGMLFVFKYFMFVSEQLGKLVPGLDTALSIALPLGISFYTFQALSYVIDVYRDVSKVEKNIINVALYISLFPQLVAGPIVRWDMIRYQLNENYRGGTA